MFFVHKYITKSGFFQLFLTQKSFFKTQKPLKKLLQEIFYIMNISIIGCGRWGSFLAWYCTKIGHTVTNYGRADSPSFVKLKTTGQNEWIKLDQKIKLSCDLKSTIESADIVLVSIGCQNFRSFLKQIAPLNFQNKPFVLCMKGIELNSGKRLSQVAIEEGIDKNNVAVWVGPGHIQEFINGKPSAMVIDSYCKDLKTKLCAIFKSPLIRIYEGVDIIGTEIGAAAKNIMGIAAGGLDGSGLTSMKGALIARGAREVSRLIKALGGNELSAYGLCHLGDYEATLFSEHSHNRKFGEMLVKGERFEYLAEGIMTAQAMSDLAKKVGVEMPITNAVCNAIDGLKPEHMIEEMFKRKTGSEFD